MSSTGSEKGDLASAEASLALNDNLALTAAAAVAAVKAGHNDTDIAAKIIAENVGVDESWSPAEDKKLLRKMDLALIPILFICATWSGLDKATLSTAALYGLKKDTHITSAQYSLIGSAPYFGGLAFMPFHGWMLQRVPIVKYFAFNVLAWGIIEICFAACTNYAGLFICRFFLGGAESLLIPVVSILVAMWYKNEEMPVRNSIILNVIAPILNGFVSWLVGYYHGKEIAAWKIIFIAIGGFNILFSAVVYFYLPDNPLTARGFTSREKYMIVKRKTGDNTGMESKARKPEQVWEAVKDPKAWILFFAIIALQIPNGGLTVFNSLFIAGLGFSAQHAALLSMPPGLMSTLSGIAISYFASRTRKYRTPIIAGSALIPLLGALMMYKIPRHNIAGQVIGLYLSYCYWGVYSTLISLYQSNVAGHTKKTVLYTVYYLAWASGNIIGPQTYRTGAPEYNGGTTALICCYIAAIFLVLSYGALCKRENTKRDIASGGEKDLAETEWLDKTDVENKNFRYTT